MGTGRTGRAGQPSGLGVASFLGCVITENPDSPLQNLLYQVPVGFPAATPALGCPFCAVPGELALLAEAGCGI